MNKLEEYVTKAAEVAELTYARYFPDEQSQAIAHDCFKEGAEYVIDLELPVKFADWLEGEKKKGLKRSAKGFWYHSGPSAAVDQPDRSTEQIYEFWIENIYGK